MRAIESLDTPAVLVDRAVAERNLRSMSARAAAAGVALCPHTKTHKSPLWAWRQLDLGATRVMVAKLDEATGLLEAGITRQVIGYPLIGTQKHQRLARLLTAGLSPVVAVDSEAAAGALDQTARQTDHTIDVLIEVDTGFQRCGFADPADAARFATWLSQHTALRVQGITAFGGHIARAGGPAAVRQAVLAEDQRLGDFVRALASAGFRELTVSQGGTLAAAYLDELTAATEIRPGTYIYNDAATVAAGAARWEDCAASILTTVVSMPSPNHAVVDAGSKTLSLDGPVGGSFGFFRDRPGLRMERLSEEHGIVAARPGERLHLSIGDRLRVIPNHVCTMINLHDAVYLVEGDAVVGRLPITGRGGVR
ncbi:MAG: alanine racemase [Thermaerobacter sp.]|nr:alanine racemase [Thermaerobacter sp.]